ncbi:hypothetical protein PILCRDRAFT_91238 [Piloderma croceum F 1598]|uniref:Uncharacterized protein n=1 Tax=Piloderma croceum (strain F 1598) TaxID=765440 RepID=A0A0C3ATE2_PILCF|nr:hypothetical protein PILCRDRAFT_91238 [Piloderma croceum F 1598]
MATTPLEILVLVLTNAKGDKLQFWIDQANQDARKHVISKTGKVNMLRHMLALHYSLDLISLSQSVPHGHLPLNEHIQLWQWDHLWQLGDQWAKETAAGNNFLLCLPSAAGNCDATQNLEVFHTHYLKALVMGAVCPATTDLPSTAPTLNCDIPPSKLQQEVAVQAGMVAACSRDIESLTRADGLHKLYMLFKKELNGDKEHFFASFSKKQHEGNRGCSLMAFQIVVEAILHMEKDLWDEEEKPEYVSEVTWVNRWKGLNKMEILRAIVNHELMVVIRRIKPPQRKEWVLYRAQDLYPSACMSMNGTDHGFRKDGTLFADLEKEWTLQPGVGQVQPHEKDHHPHGADL